MRAIDIIVDAFERLNRLSPGETLNADDAARGFSRLNIVVDELSAQAQFLYRSVLTSATQTGHITLGAGDWAAIPAGTDIVGVTVDDLPISRLTMRQYHELHSPTVTGSPTNYAPDGLSTIYLYPEANGQTVELLTRVGASEFADQTTEYTAPPGFKSALGAILAVRLAPAILGKLPAELAREETRALSTVSNYEPRIVDVRSHSRGPVHSERTRILSGG